MQTPATLYRISGYERNDPDRPERETAQVHYGDCVFELAWMPVAIDADVCIETLWTCDGRTCPDCKTFDCYGSRLACEQIQAHQRRTA